MARREIMYLLIVNPKAGRGQSVIKAQAIESQLEAHGIKYDTVFTTGVNCGLGIAKEFCSIKGQELKGIIGIGGDGTIQEIVAGMADVFPLSEKIPIPLCICPAGSGNDFILSVLGKKCKKADKNFLPNLMSNNKKAIDIITANNRAYLNIGNVGIDAWIVKNAETKKKEYGHRAYLAAVYKSIMSYKPTNLVIEANGTVFDGAFTLVAVCNGQYYGGGLQVSPSARIDDGKITLCIVESMSKIKTMAIFPSLMIKKHIYLKTVSFHECESVKITFLDDGGILCLDGNLSPAKGSIQFKIYKQVLDIIV